MPALCDLTGQVFGRLTVVRRARPKNRSRGTYWLCRCVCGRLRTPCAQSLKDGRTTSCGCFRDEKARRLRNDLTGATIGWLSVLHVVRRSGAGIRYAVRCRCGKEFEVASTVLRKSKQQKSCGCDLSWLDRFRCHPTHGRMLSTYRRNARERGLLFDLTAEQFSSLVTADCHYCAAPPAPLYSHAEATGLDRIDNGRGYTADNVVSCCRVCNRAKSTMTYDDFTAWIRRLVARHQSGAEKG